jgi:hypothetical protein
MCTRSLDDVVGQLAHRLSSIYDITLDTQVLHFASLAVPPTNSEALNAFVLPASTLSDFLSSESMVLDMTSSTVKTLNFLLYVPAPGPSPCVCVFLSIAACLCFGSVPGCIRARKRQPVMRN